MSLKEMAKHAEEVRIANMRLAISAAKTYIEDTFDTHIVDCVHNGPFNAGGRAEGTCSTCDAQRAFYSAVGSIHW